MSTPKETAEAFLYVIKKIFKWLFLAVLTIAVVGGVIIFVVDYKDKADRKARDAIESKVKVNAYHSGDKDCHDGFPYTYTVFNETDKRIKQVRFTVEITKKGFSKVLNSYTSLEEDKILEPKEGYGRCFRAQNADYNGDVKEKDVDIKIVYKNITFVDE